MYVFNFIEQSCNQALEHFARVFLKGLCEILQRLKRSAINYMYFFLCKCIASYLQTTINNVRSVQQCCT